MRDPRYLDFDNAVHKAQAGQIILCPNGHVCGTFIKRIGTKEPILLDAVHLDKTLITPTSFICDECGESVAIIADGRALRVLTEQGWRK